MTVGVKAVGKHHLEIKANVQTVVALLGNHKEERKKMRSNILDV